ncbi:MAG: sulfatase [Candidatus Latescibacterota bacterium]
MSRDTGISKWRACALAFLFAALPAILIGAAETALVLKEFTPSLRELLYGANIHLLMALLALLAARILFWKRSSQSFVPAALAMYGLAELCATASFWILKSSLAPTLASTSGKLFAAATLAISFLVGIGFIRFAIQRLQFLAWARLASGRAAVFGMSAIVIVAAVNSFLLIRHYVFDRRPPVTSGRNIDADASFSNVFIILIDTLRRDHLSCFGYERPTSKNIDSLARDSYVFDCAYTPSNKTVPSIASIFTGLYPTSHRISGPFQYLSVELQTMAGQFRSHGYSTGAFVANRLVSVKNGYDRGFDAFFPPGLPWWYYHGRTGLETLINHIYIPRDAEGGRRLNDELFDWLDKTDGRPRFAYIHYMEPHSNYAPPDEDYAAVSHGIPRGPDTPPMFHQYSKSISCIDWRCVDSPPILDEPELKGMIACYDGEIHQVDHYAGAVLEELRRRGLFEDAHIVFLTDHGEEFGDHGGWFHGHSIYEELTRSPLLYRPPGGIKAARTLERPSERFIEQPLGLVIQRPIGLLDFFATLYRKTGVTATPLHQGTVIKELDGGGGEPPAPRSPIVSSLPPYLYSMRLGPWKLIRRGDPSHPVDLLFDLSIDPGEMTDLAHELPDTLVYLQDYLEAILASREAIDVGEGKTHMDPETMKKLRTLGYIE